MTYRDIVEQIARDTVASAERSEEFVYDTMNEFMERLDEDVAREIGRLTGT